jgi:hypothetical protein
MFCFHRPFKYTVQYLLKTYNNNGNPRGTLIVVLRWSWILFQRELQKGFTSNPFIWDTRKWWELSVYSIRQFRLLHANWTGQSDVKTKTLRYCLLLPALNVVQLVIHHRLWNPPTSLPYDTWKLIIYELDSVVAPYQPGWFFTTQSPNSVTNDSFGSRFRDRAGEKKSDAVNNFVAGYASPQFQWLTLSRELLENSSAIIKRLLSILSPSDCWLSLRKIYALARDTMWAEVRNQLQNFALLRYLRKSHWHIQVVSL